MTQFGNEPIQADQNGTVVIELGKQQAGKAFYVNVTPAPKRLTPEEWQALFDDVAGKWEGDSPDPDEPPAK